MGLDDGQYYKSWLNSHCSNEALERSEWAANHTKDTKTKIGALLFAISLCFKKNIKDAYTIRAKIKIHETFRCIS
jgi:hypothetical protein